MGYEETKIAADNLAKRRKEAVDRLWKRLKYNPFVAPEQAKAQLRGVLEDIQIEAERLGTDVATLLKTPPLP
jgi:hypothetical protein